MKMGRRDLKHLDRRGVRVLNKTEPTAAPKNRAERRLAMKILRSAEARALREKLEREENLDDSD
jgi:hypothetical protein